MQEATETSKRQREDASATSTADQVSKRRKDDSGACSANSEMRHAVSTDRNSSLNTLKKLLKYCQEIVTKRDDSNCNIIDNVFFYGQDFQAFGLEKSKGNGWFSVCDDQRYMTSSSAPDQQRELYYDLFDHHRKSKLNGGNVLCGLGIVRKKHTDKSKSLQDIWHPIIVVHLDIEELENGLKVTPSSLYDPALWPMSSDGIFEDDALRALEDEFKKHLESLEAKSMQISPLQKETYHKFLKKACAHCKRDLQEAHSKPISTDSTLAGYWDPVQDENPEFFDEWVLFSQDAGHSNSKIAVQGFIKSLESESCNAPPWALFVAERMEKKSGSCQRHDSVTCEEFFFPLESNEQQQDIARMLRQNHTVVVQGPPGTGKTHTLANLVSNEAAQGKRVLVISTGQHALEVFMDKLPPFLNSIAMFFGDGQEQEYSHLIKAVEKVREISEEDSKDTNWRTDTEAKQEALKKDLLRCEKSYINLERQLQYRAKLVLLPLSRVIQEYPPELEKAISLRKELADQYAGKEMCAESLGALIDCLCSTEEICQETEWLDDLSDTDKDEIRNFLVNKLIPILRDIFEAEVYQNLRSVQQKILNYTKVSTELQLQINIVENTRRNPDVSMAANAFLHNLKAGQEKGKGHQARHWKHAKQILAEESNLVNAFPLWVMTTRMVLELLPSTFGLFDVIAIDEASKSGISELPALLLGKKLLVIGDKQQVSPNDLHMKKGRLEELDRHRKNVAPSVTLQDSFATDKSIFDLFHALHINDVKILREHFRCALPIIKFCNDNFYNGKLEPLRVSMRGKRMVPQIRCTNILASSPTKPDTEEMQAILINEVQRIVDDPNEGLEKRPDGSFVERNIGIVVLGVGLESESMSKKLSKKLKLCLGSARFKKHKIRCGGPADFQGDEKDIVLALLPSKRLSNNISISRWNQAVNVAVSRARERFHLFHMAKPAEMANCKDDDPRKKLVLYCEDLVKEFDSRSDISQFSILKGFAKQLADELSCLGVDVRTCGEILPDAWKNKMIVVEGKSRMIAIVLNGARLQTVDVHDEERKKWAVLSRIGWRVLVCWHFEFLTNRSVFISKLMEKLKFEEALYMKAPIINSEDPEPYLDRVRVSVSGEEGSSIFYTVDGTIPNTSSFLYDCDKGISIVIGNTTVRALAVRQGYRDSDVSSRRFIVRPSVIELVDDRMSGPETMRCGSEALASPAHGSARQGASSMDHHSEWRTVPSLDLKLAASDYMPAMNVVSAENSASQRQTVMPSFKPNGGRFERKAEIAIIPANVQDRIYYTLDGSEPTPSSELYSGPIVIESSTPAIRAIAIAEAQLPSIVASSRKFTIRVTPSNTTGEKVEAEYGEAMMIDETCDRSLLEQGSNAVFKPEGHDIHDILSRTQPQKDHAEDEDVIIIDEPSDTTVLPKVSRPVFQPDGGSFSKAVSVEIKTATPGSSIYYTMDGTNPGKKSLRYTGPVSVGPKRCVLRAIAIREGCESSETITSQEFTFWWCRLEPMPLPTGLPQEVFAKVDAAVSRMPIEVGLEHDEFLFCGKRKEKTGNAEMPAGWVLAIDDQVISRKHCCLQRTACAGDGAGAGTEVGGAVMVKNLGKNGTNVNGNLVPEGTRVQLKDGDRIVLSPNRYTSSQGVAVTLKDKSPGELFGWTVCLPKG